MDTIGHCMVAGRQKQNDIQMENMYFGALIDNLRYLIPNWSVYHCLYLFLLFAKHLYVIYVHSIKPHNNPIKIGTFIISILQMKQQRG